MSASFRACVVLLLVAPFGAAKAQVPTSTQMAVPDEDRDTLADLAPPSDRATAQGTYGDAAFARARPQSSSRSATELAEERRACAADRDGPVDPRCTDRLSAFFRKNYVYTPSYVSAPQEFQPSPSGQTNLLSPITSFFLNPFGQHDPAAER